LETWCPTLGAPCFSKSKCGTSKHEIWKEMKIKKHWNINLKHAKVWNMAHARCHVSNFG
jgi:hypothetical protein